ncbi:MAG: DNA-binding protein [Thermoplasmata archaeon]|nr:DNA-binding protein [Thermoplasmata archaeon]MCI4356746.1 DNA-binding protein [Thermoplasmata archaeon]
MVRLDEGEQLPEAFVDLARRHQIRAAAIPMGIGQLVRAKVGFWTGTEYAPKLLESPVELVSLSGSIAESDGEPSVHLHATLGTAAHETVSGHLLSGTVGLLVESLVEVFPDHRFARPLDESVGLRRLDLGTARSVGRQR